MRRKAVIPVLKLLFSNWKTVSRLSLLSFTDHAINVVLRAREHAAQQHHCEVTPEHILLALAADSRGIAAIALGHLGLDLSAHQPEIAALVDTTPVNLLRNDPSLGVATEQLLSRTRDEARASGHQYVGTEHLIIGLLTTPGLACEYLRGHGITMDHYALLLRSLSAGATAQR